MRPSWEEYFMQIAGVVSTRSTCLRRHVGAVLVKNRQILATGYNGVPRGAAHCAERGCLREQLGVPSGERHELCRGLHAEQNAVIQAAFHGVAIEGAEVYCTHQPCVVCAKMLVNAGIVAVHFAGPYPDALATEVFAEAGTHLIAAETWTRPPAEVGTGPASVPAGADASRPPIAPAASDETSDVTAAGRPPGGKASSP